MQEREDGRQSHKYQRIRTKTFQNLTGSEECATESQMRVLVGLSGFHLGFGQRLALVLAAAWAATAGLWAAHPSEQLCPTKAFQKHPARARTSPSVSVSQCAGSMNFLTVSAGRLGSSDIIADEFRGSRRWEHARPGFAQDVSTHACSR